MNRFIQRLFRKTIEKSPVRPRTAHRARLSIELLEDRFVPTTIVPKLAYLPYPAVASDGIAPYHGALSIHKTAGNDLNSANTNTTASPAGSALAGKTAATPVALQLPNGGGGGGISAGYQYLWNPQALPAPLAGQSYSATISATAEWTVNGQVRRTFPMSTYTLGSGGLPAGLSLSSSGVLSGLTTQTGTFPIVVDASGTDPVTKITVNSTKAYTLTVFGVGSLSTTSGYAPGYSAQYLQTGSAVTIYGLGFQSGTMVQFGGSGPLAAATAIDPNGTWLTVNVPHGAETGRLRVILPNGTTVLQSAQTFTVHDYLNTYGFNFTNFNIPGITWGIVKGEFGGDQVDVMAGPIDTGVPSPFALAYWRVVAAALNGKGACFGMALTSDLLAAGGQTVYSLPETGALVTTIEQNHLAQTSAQAIHYAASWALSGHSAGGIYNQLSTLLAGGDHPIITMAPGTEGHAVVAYDLEPGPKGNGDFYIDVYDSNLPAYSLGSEQGTEVHSRVYIDPAAGWSCAPQGFASSGYATSLMVIPSGVLSGQLTMPASLGGLLTIIFGSGTPAPQSLPVPLAGQSYSATIRATGERTVNGQVRRVFQTGTYTLGSGGLPAGLSLGSSGVPSGLTTQTGASCSQAASPAEVQDTYLNGSADKFPTTARTPRSFRVTLRTRGPQALLVEDLTDAAVNGSAPISLSP
jgi:hypothetical protein